MDICDRTSLLIILVCFLTLIARGGVTMAETQNGPPVLGIEATAMGDFTSPESMPATEPPGTPPPPGAITGHGAPPGQVAIPHPPPPRVGLDQRPSQPMGSEVLGNATLAIKTARNTRKYFTSWKLWKHRGPAGEVVIKAAVIYRRVAVACMDFDPLTGDVLPKGYHPINYEARLSLDDIRKELPAIIANLKVLDGAEFRDKERCWIVPLAYEGKIVAHVKVYHDGIHIVPDYPVDQEMRAYGS
ncbi:MAG: hypothetical protein DRG83_02875 [Deltaproteobacteria bacterium]|nr:MAG: hypothetical protein DRG83_02875 [Deltaproteobacteria bacterium]